jgi:hypothetical protein
MTPENKSHLKHGLLKTRRSRNHVFHCVCTDTQWDVRDLRERDFELRRKDPAARENHLHTLPLARV